MYGRNDIRRLAVIPSDPLEAYRTKGTSGWLTSYYNPTRFFDEVYCLSPVEPTKGAAFGMTIIPTTPHELPGRIQQLGIGAVRCYGGFWPCDMGCNNKIPGVPVIVSVHDSAEHLLHDSIRDADHVLALSGAVRSLLLQRGVEPERIHDLPNRVDPEIFRPMDEQVIRAELEGKFPGRYHIVHVGRKSPEKNLETVICALALLGPEYVALFIGQGDLAPYHQLAVRLGVVSQCVFIPAIQNDQLPFLYSYADVVCTPSLREGFGLAIVEALACGAAVVTSNIAPMVEYIRHGENGLLVDRYQDPAAIAESIRAVCTDPVLAHRLKQAAPDSVARFHKGRVDRLEASLYDRFLEVRE